MHFHVELSMDTLCGVEEDRGAGLGMPSALLHADHCSLGQACVPAEAVMAYEGVTTGSDPPRFRTGQPPCAPTTCRVATLMRLKALMAAMLMINAARAC
jgi:hypothetical protein